jgi:hypothetical protein
MITIKNNSNTDNFDFQASDKYIILFPGLNHVSDRDYAALRADDDFQSWIEQNTLEIITLDTSPVFRLSKLQFITK